MLVRFLASNVMQISAPAKVNLYLELLGKRSDGFHELETIMTTVSLFDQLSFTANSTGQLKLSIHMPESLNHQSAIATAAEPIPTDERNLVIKSLLLLRRLKNETDADVRGMDVRLIKRIPSSAGLGGASSNAAAALIAGNALWNLNLSPERLHEAAAEIGSDVPFFLEGGMALCRGRGERISPIAGPAGLPILIAKPPEGLSTPHVFSQCDLPGQPRQNDSAITGVLSGQPSRIGSLMFNRLQPAATRLLDDIALLEKEFADLPCLGHQMSGSGSSYFGVFQNRRVAHRALARLSARWPALKIHCVTSLNRSDSLIA